MFSVLYSKYCKSHIDEGGRNGRKGLQSSAKLVLGIALFAVSSATTVAGSLLVPGSYSKTVKHSPAFIVGPGAVIGLAPVGATPVFAPVPGSDSCNSVDSILSRLLPNISAIQASQGRWAFSHTTDRGSGSLGGSVSGDLQGCRRCVSGPIFGAGSGEGSCESEIPADPTGTPGICEPGGSNPLVVVGYHLQPRTASQPGIFGVGGYDTLGLSAIYSADTLMITVPHIGVQLVGEATVPGGNTFNGFLNYVESAFLNPSTGNIEVEFHSGSKVKFESDPTKLNGEMRAKTITAANGSVIENTYHNFTGELQKREKLSSLPGNSSSKAEFTWSSGPGGNYVSKVEYFKGGVKNEYNIAVGSNGRVSSISSGSDTFATFAYNQNMITNTTDVTTSTLNRKLTIGYSNVTFRDINGNVTSQNGDEPIVQKRADGNFFRGFLSNPSNPFQRRLLLAENRAIEQTITAGTISETPLKSFSYNQNFSSGWSALTNIQYHQNSNIATFNGNPGYSVVMTGRPDSFTTSTGSSTTFVYSNGRVTSQATATDSNQFAYDNQGRLLTVSDNQGIVKEYIYLGQNIQKVKQNGETTEYTRDSDGNITSKIDDQGTSTYVWNQGLLASYKSPTDSVSNNIVRNIDGSIHSVSDQNGQTTTMEYTSNGLVKKIINSDGTFKQYKYFLDSNIVEFSRDRLGFVTQQKRNLAGDITEKIRGEKIATDLYSGGGMTNIGDPILVKTVEYQFNNLGEVVSKRENGSLTEYFYDYLGRMVKKRKHTSVGNYVDSEKIYGSDDRLFCEIDEHGYKTYIAWGNLSRQIIRKFKCLTLDYPPVTDVADLLNRTRDLNVDVKFALTDMVYDRGLVSETINETGRKDTFTYDNNGNIIRKEEGTNTPSPISTEFDYDSNNNKILTRNPRYFDSSDVHGYQKDAIGQTFNNKGQLVSTTIAPGSSAPRTTTFQYDNNGRKTQVVNPNGAILKYHYKDCCGKSSGTEDALGHGLITNRNAGGNIYHLARVSDIASHSDFKDPIDNKTTKEITIRQDAHGRETARTVWNNPLGQVLPTNVPIAGEDGIDPNDGVTSKIFYDDNLNDGIGFDSITGFSVKAPVGSVKNISINNCKTILSQSVANGGAGITIGPDSTGSAIITCNHDGSMINVSIEVAGKTVMLARLFGHNFSNSSDVYQSFCMEDASSTNIANFGMVTRRRIIRSAGRVSEERFDGSGNLKEEYDFNGTLVSKYSHRPDGLLVSKANALGHSKSFAFDSFGRVTTSTNELNEVKSVSYDFNGNIVSETDAKGNTSQFEFDVFGQKVKETDRIGGIKLYAYDSSGNNISFEDQDGHITSFQYNLANQRTAVIRPDHVSGSPVGSSGYGKELSEFDSEGRNFRFTNQDGFTITRQYDLLGNVISIDYRSKSNSPSGPIAHSNTYEYTSSRNLKKATSSRFSNVIDFTRDGLGRLTTESLSKGGQFFSVGVGYDNEGRENEIIYPDGTSATLKYNNIGLVSELDFNNTNVLKYNYDLNRNLTKREFFNGIKENLSYYDDGSMKEIDGEHLPGTSNNNKLGKRTYTYDQNGDLISESISGVMNAYGFTSSFDQEQRISGWNRADGNLNQTWNRSLVGNWNSSTENGTTTSRSHNSVHEITSLGGIALTSDSLGNLTSNSNGHQYTWSEDSLLLGVNTDGNPGDEVSFEYDALGRRVGKNNKTFINFGQRTIGVSTGVSLTKYLLGNYADDVVAEIDSTGNICCFHNNNRFSPVAKSDSNGNIQKRFSQSAYGKTVEHSAAGTANSNSVEGPAFTGRYADSETGLIHFRSRYYDTNLGRFISRDKKGFVDGSSLYQGYFAASGLDPSGNQQIRRKYVQKKFVKTITKRKYVLRKKPGPTFIKNPVDMEPGCYAVYVYEEYFKRTTITEFWEEYETPDPEEKKNAQDRINAIGKLLTELSKDKADAEKAAADATAIALGLEAQVIKFGVLAAICGASPDPFTKALVPYFVWAGVAAQAGALAATAVAVGFSQEASAIGDQIADLRRELASLNLKVNKGEGAKWVKRRNMKKRLVNSWKGFRKTGKTDELLYLVNDKFCCGILEGGAWPGQKPNVNPLPEYTKKDLVSEQWFLRDNFGDYNPIKR